MDNKDLFMKLLKEFAKDGEISEMEMMILKEKATTVGIDENSLNILIEMELASVSNTDTPTNDSVQKTMKETSNDENINADNSSNKIQEEQEQQETEGLNKLQIIEL